MKLKFKDTPNSSTRALTKPVGRIPSFPSPHMSPNSFYNNKPVKSNSSNLTFTGFLYKDAIKFNVEDVLKITDTYLGKSVRNRFNNLNELKDSPILKNLINIDGDEIKFFKKTIPHHILDGLAYPFKILPGDMLNGIVDGLKKIGPLKGWAEGIYESKTLKNIRQRSEADSIVNDLRGVFETVDSMKGKIIDKDSSELFIRSTKMLDNKTGNYDTKHERSLNRIVSGLIPAVFLANDAYNLSRMCNDDKKEANKERKIRFKQEASRIGVSAYLMLITYGALQKHINNSKAAVMAMTGITVLFTETISRLSNGKHIKRLTPEEAQAINAKEGYNKGHSEPKVEEKYKSVFFRSAEKRKSFASFQGNMKDTPEAIIKEEKPVTVQDKNIKKQEPLLSFNSLMKGAVIALAAGYAIKGARKITAVDDLFKSAFKPFQDAYKKLTVDANKTISKKEFEKILDTLIKSEDFEPLVKKYREIADKYTDEATGLIELGKKDKPFKPLIDFIIEPFKFAYGIVEAPYYWTNKLVGAITKAPKAPAKAVTEQEALAKSLDYLQRQIKRKDFDPKNLTKFHQTVEKNILKAFNGDNVSGISNSELANLAKTSSTAAVMWFLMTDNYNMVMLKSNGKDKEGAELKFKERFVQEMSRFFYQTLLISLFNNTFRSQYNNSLFGMTWVTSLCTIIGENLTRVSVGMPVKRHSRDEIYQMERDKENASPLVKGYYGFMSKLTGKKSLSEMQALKTNNK